MKKSELRKIIHEVVEKMLTEGKVIAIDFPPYSIEYSILKGSDAQILYKKNGKLFRAIDVEPNFDKKKFIELGKTIARRMNRSITTDLEKL